MRLVTLRRRRDFERLRREGRAYRHHLMTVSVAANETGRNRYGFVTGRRLGKAVQRNRTRRLLREATRQLNPDLKQGFDIVIIARQQLVGQPFASVYAVIKALIEQAGLVESDVQ